MDQFFKTIKQLVLYSLLFVVLAPISCIIKPQTRLQAYYEFRDDDLNKIMQLELHQEIIFTNNVGETIIFKVEKATEDYKKQVVNGGGSFLGVPIPYSYHFYFDEEIALITSDTENYYMGYRFRRFPKDRNQAIIEDYTELPSEFLGFYYLYNWNGEEKWNGFGAGDSGAISIDYEATTIEITFNSKTYSNVYVIESGNPEPAIDGVIIRKVNIIYYDLYKGIIGFDETDGTEWRLSN